jgi:glycosyltransferase involved in cell wall biosynthesis
VADIRPYLADAALTVVPLRIGGGTRLKILEASAAGVATVSSTVGAEGLNFLPGREIVLADEPNQFAEDIIALLKDERLRQHMAQAARRRVIDQYSFSRLKTLVEDCLTAVTSQNRLPHVLTKA